MSVLYRTVKTLAVKNFGEKDCRKLGGKNFGELKSICIRNVMEIVKIGENTWQNAVNQQCFFTANVFYCRVYYFKYCLYIFFAKGKQL